MMVSRFEALSGERSLDHELLTVEEVAWFLHVEPATVRTALQAGGLASERDTSGRRGISLEEARRYLRAGAAAPFTVSPLAATPPRETVECPRCGLECGITRLKMPGHYRLMDACGRPHSEACIGTPPVSVTRYRQVGRRELASTR